MHWKPSGSNRAAFLQGHRLSRVENDGGGSERRLTFKLNDHRNSFCMPAALEFGDQERINDIERQPLTYDARAYREHVGVVVLSDHASGECVRAYAAANTLNLVGRHHDALTSATQDDAEMTVA